MTRDVSQKVSFNITMDDKWIGERCDICGKPFAADDDIAVCPDCGAPYHRACIQEKRVCVHADLHAKGERWISSKEAARLKSEQSANSMPRRCPNCGNENPRSSRYCSRCGTSLAPDAAPSGEDVNAPRVYPDPYGRSGQGSPFPPNFTGQAQSPPYSGINPNEELAEGVTMQETAAYVKKNPLYFLTRFKLMKRQKYTMNFSALLFGGIYYLYRKVYSTGVLFLLVQIVLSVPSFIIGVAYALQAMSIQLPFEVNLTTLSSVDMIFSFIRMALMFVSGFFFNYFYRNQTIQKVKKVKEKNLPAEQTLAELSARGGVNLALIIVLMVAYFALYYLIILFLVR